MPMTADQLAAGANAQLATYSRETPVDQFTSERPFADWLIKNRKDSTFGNGLFNEQIRVSNDSNYQNYFGDDQVSYNRKDTVRQAPFQYFAAHDGFALNEHELQNNGITMTDDKTSVVSDAEKIQLYNKLDECYTTLKDGFQENWDSEVHRDGSQSTKAVPGLDALVSVDGTGVIGGIDASAQTYWKNNFNTGISTASAGTLIAAMETEWRKCITHGKLGAPNYIQCGSKFLDAYAKDCRDTNSYQVSTPGKGGVNLDGSRSGVFFKGIELVWDPTMDALQAALDPAIDWDKRCYFLNSKALILRPVRGRWLVNRKPPRIYDRYTYYFGLTADYGMTVKQRNAMSVLSIA